MKVFKRQKGRKTSVSELTEKVSQLKAQLDGLTGGVTSLEEDDEGNMHLVPSQQQERVGKKPESNFGVEAHSVDAALAFVAECRDLLGKEPSFDPLPGRLGQLIPPSFTIVPLSIDTKGPVLALGRVTLPFGVTTFAAGSIVSGPALNCIYVEGKEGEFKSFCERVQSRARSDSIYRGKIVDSVWDFLPHRDPMVVLPPEKEEEVEANLMLPIKARERWGELGLPEGSKRTVMLIGPPGNGKTLTAHRAMAEAIRHGWTVMVIRTQHMQILPLIIKAMRIFKPALLFIEDIDSVTLEEDEYNRGLYVNSILNTLEGAEADTSDMMFVFTSNFAERITPALKRTGRVDCIIRLDPPDAEAAARTFRHYSKMSHVPGELTERLSKLTFSDVREVVTRGRLLAAAKDEEVSVEHYIKAAMQIHDVKQLAESGSRAPIGIRQS